MLGYFQNSKPYCWKCADTGEEQINDYEEQDQVLHCHKCSRLLKVPLSPAGVEKAAVEIIPKALDGHVTDTDREVWQLYGHLLMSHLRDQLAYKEWY